MMNENELSKLIIGACIKVHRELGPGLMESAYQYCLCYELQKMGLSVEKELTLPIIYDNVSLDCGYRIDLLVEKKVVIELKSVSSILGIHVAQVHTYLKLGNYKLGLLVNFNEVLLKNGVQRIVNNL